MFRLNQKHSKNLYQPRQQVDGKAVVAAQSLLAAGLAALGAVVILNSVWMMSAELLGRVFPWFVIIQSILIGLAVRRFGRGLDWRFPVVAAIAAAIGAYSGNFLLAADVSADEFGTDPLHIVTHMSEWTLGVYFEEVVSPIDHIYAIYSAAIAAFLARRRLTRAQVYAVRTLHQEGTGDDREN